MKSLAAIRSQFPILKRKVNGKPLAYLDNASTTQKPKVVIDAIKRNYERSNANVHRGINTLSEESTKAYEDARETVARFIGASRDELIFTRNTTDSLNMIARMLEPHMKTRGEILVTQMEHHSNLVPWQQLCKRTGTTLKILPITDEGRWDMEQLPRFLTNKTNIVAAAHSSNVLGTINPIASLSKSAHAAGAVMVVDGAQAAAHVPINVRTLGCDFYALSAHKMYGPTGIGALYGKREALENLEPIAFGGDMVKSVEWYDAQWNDLPWKFEAGTPHVTGAIGWAAAIDVIMDIGMEQIEAIERNLTHHLLSVLKNIPDVTMYGPQTSVNRTGIVSFTIGGIHPHDIATILDREGIAIRSGHHCAMPLMVRLGVTATNRASIAVYNTKKEIDRLGKAIEKALDIFRPNVSVPVQWVNKNLWQK